MATTTPVVRETADDRSPSRTDGSVRSRLPTVGKVAAIAASWLILRPYLGIVHDALLYVHVAEFGRSDAFARLDVLVANDRQMDRSVFVPLMRPAIDALGVAAAAMLTAVAGLIAWIAGLAVLARVLVGRDWWIVAVGFPAFGAYWGPLFFIGEPFATPRVFAEAAVLASLALVLGHRAGWATAVAIAACALHPIVGLTGLAVVVIVVVMDRPRLVPYAAAAAVAAVLVAAWDPLRIAGTAGFTTAWLGIIAERAGLVLPGEWPAVAWMRTAFGFSVVGALYLTSVDGPTRRLSAATLVGATAGLGASVLFSWVWIRPLVTQLQPWRILWLLHLVAIVGVIMFTIDAVRTARASSRVRALAAWAVTLAVVLTSSPMLFVLVLVIAIPLMLPHRGRVATLVEHPRFLHALVAFTCLLAGVQVIVAVARIAFVEEWDRIPWLAYSSRLPAFTALVAACLVLAVVALGRSGGARVAGVGILAVALAFGLATWDHRTPWQEFGEALEEPIADLPPDAIVLVESDDLASATLLRRPTYYSNYSGAGVVFSEDLAVVYTHHASLARMLGVSFALNYRLGDIPLERRRAPSLAVAASACADPMGPTHLFLRRRIVGLQGTEWTSPVPVEQAPRGTANDAVIPDGFVLYACSDVLAAS